MSDMKDKKESFFGSLLKWIDKQFAKKYAFLLAAILFVGEIFFLLPLDIVLVFLVKKHPKRFFLISMFAAFCSVLSGGLGYFIGKFTFEKINPWVFNFMSRTLFLRLVTIYKSYEMMVVFICCLIPMPFKVISLSAGFCNISLTKFLLTIFVSRIIRFSIISFISLTFKNQIIEFVERNSLLIAGAATIILLLILLMWIKF